MTEYSNELRGVLFKNNRKRPDKKDPDYTGSAEIGGVGFFLDAWINEPKGGGEKYMALKFKAKEQKAAEPAPKQDEFIPDSDIPF